MFYTKKKNRRRPSATTPLLVVISLSVVAVAAIARIPSVSAGTSAFLSPAGGFGHHNSNNHHSHHNLNSHDAVKLTGKSSGSAGPESLDMDELRKRINSVSNPYSSLFRTGGDGAAQSPPPSSLPSASAAAATKRLRPVQPQPQQQQQQQQKVHIILFQGEKQGVHSIEYPKGSGSNVVLAFESKRACDKFAAMLKRQQFFEHPTVREIEYDSLESFCADLGVYAQVVPDGVDVIPPSERVKDLGQKNPSLRNDQKNLEYVFSMDDGADFEEDGVLMPGSGAFDGSESSASEFGSWE